MTTVLERNTEIVRSAQCDGLLPSRRLSGQKNPVEYYVILVGVGMLPLGSAALARGQLDSRELRRS